MTPSREAIEAAARELDIFLLKYHKSPVLEYALERRASDPNFPASETSLAYATCAITAALPHLLTQPAASDEERARAATMCRHDHLYDRPYCMTNCLCARIASLLAAVRAERAREATLAATLAERERCADMAEHLGDNEIATAIRRAE